MGPTAPSDTPIEVHGHATDPTKDGYQILYNYESTYWRALVGNMAWGLYEVLRSFCHKQNNVCYPSINLLLDILGLKERRVLTGWIKMVKGKEYRYPGLIEKLYNHKLLVAQVEGEGPKMRYVFHVNLTPALLTAKQLELLSPLLQKKHAELLERCHEAQRTLQNKQRPSKVNPPPAPGPEENKEGMVIYQRGSGKLPERSGNLPAKQHQYNSTHRTNTGERQSNNRESSLSGVVVALSSRGISKRVAEQLAREHQRNYIEEKIEFHDFLSAERPRDIKKPAAWLRKAIEDDYKAPDGFGSVAERQRQDAEAKRRKQAVLAAHEAQAEAAEAALHARRAQTAQQLARLQEAYGTTAQAQAFWRQVQDELKRTATGTVFALIADASILQLSDDKAVVGVASAFNLTQLAHPNIYALIRRAARVVAQRPVEIEFTKVGESVRTEGDHA